MSWLPEGPAGAMIFTGRAGEVCARLVLDDEGLAEAARQLIGQEASDDVVAAGGPDRHDDLDRAVGIGLREAW
jgi:hypothetical protein